ncbi:MAG: alpha/beta hydrolase [Rhizomicrobium sp.]
MSTITRRGFVKSMGAAPLVIGAAIDARSVAAAAAAPGPWSYVDPELAAALKKFPPVEDPSARNLAALRAGDTASSVSKAPQLQPRKATVPGPAGQKDVPVLIIDPKPNQKNRPATVYIHGGGFVVGRADTNLQLAQDIAEATQSLVVSVDYTLAPEAVFPIAREQNYAALAWVHENAGRLGIDRERIAVMGDSAGGGHAAMLAIAARDRGKYKIAYQCLIYPMLDDRTGSTNRVPPYIGHFNWTEAANRFGWTSLLGVAAGSASVPQGAVPARVTNLAGLPPTFIGVGSIDLFFAEDVEYAKRLALSGVSTELHVMPGAYHGFDVVTRTAKLTVHFRNAWQTALRRGLGL